MKKYSFILFVVFILAIAFYYNYQGILFRQPQSIHAWRQSDCASIALNYYQNGMHFFSPETHNLTSDGGTTGKCCTSEVPLLYYFVALLYQLFGHHDFIFRLVNTLLFFLGLFYLFRLYKYLLNDLFWSILLSILFFTSPVLVYYGNNFLSNSSALAFAIMGWYYFIRFVKEKKEKLFYISVIIFMLAGAFKLTAFFSLIAITAVILIEVMNFRKFNSDSILFNKPFPKLLAITGAFIAVGSWVLYAHFYNRLHDCTYFSTTVFPIWDLSSSEIFNVINSVRLIWLNQYFHPSVLIFFVFCFVFVLLKFKKGDRLLNYSILIILAEIVVYCILQFWTFKDHDYYVIDIYILPVLLLLSAFQVLKESYPAIFKSIGVKTFFLIFIIFNIYYADKKLTERYSSVNNNFVLADIYKAEPYLRKIGIMPSDTIISIPDNSHISLYLMNRKGWTEYSDARFNHGSRVDYNHDSTGISLSIKKGAKYLILNGEEELHFKPYLQPFCKNLVGRFNKVLVFNLRDNSKNYEVKKPRLVSTIFCNAEDISSDGKSFKGTPDTLLFENASSRNGEEALSGLYSVKLNAQSPYGMTIVLEKVVVGEYFEISVWKKSTVKDHSGIIASSVNSNLLYLSSYDVIDKNNKGWEKLFLKFYISNQLPNDELAIYLFNPEKTCDWFDDLEIVRYKL